MCVVFFFAFYITDKMATILEFRNDSERMLYYLNEKKTNIKRQLQPETIKSDITIY